MHKTFQKEEEGQALGSLVSLLDNFKGLCLVIFCLYLKDKRTFLHVA